MTYPELKELGTKIDETDSSDGGSYLYTEEFWMTKDGLYIHEIHPCLNKYTGKTTTYHVQDISDFEKYDQYYFEKEVGLSEEGYLKAIEYIKNLKSWGGFREGAGRPSTGRKKIPFYITDEENTKLREYLKNLRKEGDNENRDAKTKKARPHA